MDHDQDIVKPDIEENVQAGITSTPKLTIADLMIWTACIAAYMGIYHLIALSTDELSADTTKQLIQLGFALSCGTATAGVIAIWKHPTATIAQLSVEPGVTLLFTIAVAGLISVVAYCCETRINSWDGSYINLALLVNFIKTLAIIIFIAKALLHIAGSRWHFMLYPWLFYHVHNLLALSSYVFSIDIFDEILPIQLIVSMIGSITVAALLVVDPLDEPNLTWLHRTGTVCLLGIYITEFSAVLYKISLNY
ncbi:MAG: hypothetical protein COA78_26610 [Blastopirellula sp.]|nr:MAG: hypothetical protein COA78_26610 [Blastopirellula sp.]